MSPRVSLTFDGNPNGALGATRKVAAGLTALKAETKALSLESLAAAGAQGKLTEGMVVGTTATRRHASAAASAEKEISRLGRGALAGSGIFHGYGRSIAFASGAFLGGAGLTSVLGSAFRAMEEGQVITARTNTTLKATGAVAGITAKQIGELAKQEARKTGADVNAVRSAENLLLTFRYVRNEAGKGNDVFDRAVKMADNLSRTWGVDLTDAASQLGKALNNPFTGYVRLQRQGVTFTNQQKEQIKQFAKVGDAVGAQRVILDELNRTVGKSAEGYGKTMPGSIGRARQAVRDLEASLLKGLSPAVTTVASDIAGWAEEQEKSGNLQRRVNADVKQGVAIVKDAAHAADAVAGAVGGWKNALGGLLALKVAGKLASWSGELSTVIGSARGGGLKGANAETSKLGRALGRLPSTVAIAIGIEFYVHRKGIGGWLGDQLDKALGLPTQSQAAAADRNLPVNRLGMRPEQTLPAWRLKLAERVVRLRAEGLSDSEIKAELTKGYAGTSGRDLVVVQALDDAAVLASTKATGSAQARLVATAKKFGPGSGGVYVTGMRGQTVHFDGAAHIAFDCSGYLQAVYKQNGIPIPATSETQWADPNALQVPKGQEQPGDGVYFTGSPKYAPPGHCGIYIGNGQFIEYYQSGKPAKVANLADRSDYWGARRWVQVKQKGGAGAPGSTFTPQNPLDFKAKPKKVAAVSATQLSAPLRLRIANAGATARLSDDISAAEAAVAFLTARLNKTTKIGIKADLQDAINGYTAAIKAAEDTIAARAKTAREKAAKAARAEAARRSEIQGIASQIGAGLYSLPGSHPGLVRSGNIDLLGRKVAHNADGSISTVKSMSINVDGREVLIPMVVNGKVVSADEAIAHYRSTGKNLGTFASVEAADAYAAALHREQAKVYGKNGAASQAAPARAIIEKAIRLDLLPVAEENKLKSQISRLSALVRRAQADGKITPAELKSIKGSWGAMAAGISDATQAVQANLQKTAASKWAGITNAIARAVAEAWSTTQRDFGRETDLGLKAINDKASADIDAMSRAFLARMDVFNRETAAGLKALEVLQTPTEALLANRLAEKTAADTTQRLADLTRARDEAVGVEQTAQSEAGSIRSRGAESIESYNKRVQDAQDAVTQATAARVKTEKDLNAEIYGEETSSLQSRADAERKAADEKTQADQDAYQASRDALAQALADEERVRELARQTQADGEAQAYQDRRDAQWQALQDLHDDQTTALTNDLDQWAAWLSTKQRSYADFLKWVSQNTVSQALVGIGPDPFTPAGGALDPGQGTSPDDRGGVRGVGVAGSFVWGGITWGPGDRSAFAAWLATRGASLDEWKKNHPATAAAVGYRTGGTVPRGYVGAFDTVMARVTPGEEIVDRSTSAALRAFLANPGGYGAAGGRPIVLQVDGREFARLMAQPMSDAQVRLLGYSAQRS